MDMRSQFLRHQRRHLTACLTRRHAIWPCPRPVQPILYRVPWSKEVISQLITDKNPNGTITNSDLELAGGLLHLKSTVQSYDVRERTIDNKTGNLATTFWQRKGSASTDKAPAHLLASTESTKESTATWRDMTTCRVYKIGWLMMPLAFFIFLINIFFLTLTATIHRTSPSNL